MGRPTLETDAAGRNDYDVRPMRRLTTGLFVGLLACDFGGPGRDACFGVCGDGTICEAERCIVAPAPPTVDAEQLAPAKARRKRGTKAAAVGRESFRAIDDRHIPLYDANETQHIDSGSGSDRLPDHTIRSHLAGLEGKLNGCIATAAEYSDGDLGRGRIDMVFGIRNTGKVSGVTVKAPPNLKVFGIVPCVRKIVYDHRFPAYDGPTTGVDYSFNVE